MNEDYVLEYGDEGTVNRTGYGTLQSILREFEAKKKDSSCTWANVVYEPLDEYSTREIIDSFRKEVQDIFGVKQVVNL